MKKLLLTKAMLLLCALVAGSGSVWAGNETSVVNFENDLATYTNWTFTDLTRTTQETSGSGNSAITVNPHGGSYFAKTSLSSGSWAVTASKIATPVSIVCYYTKATSNTNSNSQFKIQVSSDGSTWTDVSSGKTMNNVTGGTWEELSADLSYYSDVYVRVYYKGTSAVRCLDDITLTYSTGGGGGDSSDPSISASNVNLEFDDTEGEFGYTLDNPVDGATLEATSDDDWISEVAVDTENSKVTFNTTANTTASPRVGTITVTYSKGGEELATKEVTITQAKEIITVGYTLATKITPGKHYILVGKKNSTYYAMGSQNANNRTAVSITVNDGKTSIADDAGVYEVLISGDAATGYYTIYDEATPGYLYAACGAGTSNYMRTETELDDDGNGEWIMSVDGNGVASIKARNTSLGRPWMQYNSGSTLFSCYQNSDSQSDIYLYERDDDTNTQTTSVTLSALCTDNTNFYGTYSCPFSFVVPADLTVSTIFVDEGKLSFTNYAAGDIVKANTGVLVSSTTSGAHDVVLSGETGTEISGNMLKASSTGITAEDMNEADTKFYRLTMHNGTDLGFYWGAAEGAAFAVAANKAYLAVPSGQNAPAFIAFNLGGQTTGIDASLMSKEGMNHEVYNLNGQRVGQPSKGLYIVGGRKVVVK